MVDGSGREARVPTAVVEYDPSWPDMFQQIASEVSVALGDAEYVVEHVGSTAVPGLAAKPIIDLDVVVGSADQVPAVVAALGRGGWEHQGDGGIDGREMFAARGDLPYHHLYLVVRGNRQHLLHTQFRDLLRADGWARVQYAELKHALALLLLTDRVAYTEGKSNLIADLMQRRAHSEPRSEHPELSSFKEAWSLRPDGPVIHGNTAVVQPVRRSDGTVAVLRVGDPRGCASDGWRALTTWDGDGAVRLFEHDSARDVSLLERADDTRTLDALPVSRAVLIAAELRRRHDRPAPEGLRTLEMLAAQWAVDLLDAVNVPLDLRNRAAAVCRELGPGAGRHMVNVDLHYRNVLGASREPWLVIDPMPVAGDREFGLASLLWGRLEEADPMTLFEPLVEVCELDRDRARDWTIVEATVKMMRSTGRVARNCETVARTLTQK